MATIQMCAGAKKIFATNKNKIFYIAKGRREVFQNTEKRNVNFVHIQ